MWKLVLVTAVCALGCSKSRCERGVHKVFDLTAHAGPKGSEPKAEEQRVIDLIESQVVGACEDEGLSAAQLDCILAMRTFEDMQTVTACPAIAAKHPSWLMAGPVPPIPIPPVEDVVPPTDP